MKPMNPERFREFQYRLNAASLDMHLSTRGCIGFRCACGRTYDCRMARDRCKEIWDGKLSPLAEVYAEFDK